MTRILALALFLCVSFASQAQVAVPTLTGHVTDMTGTLTRDQVQTLESTLSAFEEKKGSQVAVLIVPSTAPEAIEQYSIRVAERWKLGRRKVDDGAILIVAKNDRALRIEVGYGLEGALNDAVSKRIVSEVITPRFKEGDFYGGISGGVDSMISVIQGEPLPASTGTASGFSGNYRQIGPIFFMLAFGIGAVLRSVLGRFPGAIVTAGIIGGIAWWFAGALLIAVGVGFVAFVITLAGGLGGFGMFGYGGGGSSSGGYSGGGGGFGGGGASGRW
jgi:uncharacterized protein